MSHSEILRPKQLVFTAFYLGRLWLICLHQHTSFNVKNKFNAKYLTDRISDSVLFVYTPVYTFLITKLLKNYATAAVDSTRRHYTDMLLALSFKSYSLTQY